MIFILMIRFFCTQGGKRVELSLRRLSTFNSLDFQLTHNKHWTNLSSYYPLATILLPSSYLLPTFFLLSSYLLPSGFLEHTLNVASSYLGCTLDVPSPYLGRTLPLFHIYQKNKSIINCSLLHHNVQPNL